MFLMLVDALLLNPKMREEGEKDNSPMKKAKGGKIALPLPVLGVAMWPSLGQWMLGPWYLNLWDN